MPWEDRIKRRLKLRDLDVLMKVMQCGSMGKAAQRLHMSQSAVSKSIADLEHTLGVHLLDRSRRGVEPTMYGRALDRCGVALFDELRQGLKLIDFMADPTAGELRIGTTQPLAAYVIPAIIERLSRRAPGVVFHVVEADTADLFRALDERKVDLAVTRLPESSVDKHFDTTVLFLDQLIVAASAKNPWTRRRKLALSDLIGEPWLLSPGDSFINSIQVEAFRANGLALPAATLFTSSVHLRFRLLPGGRFLTMIPGFVLKGPLRDRSVKALPIDLPMTRRPVGVVTLKNRTISPVAQLFIDMAREVVKPLTKRA
jgi:DNA-binding transcriptional LysR family regulator